MMELNAVGQNGHVHLIGVLAGTTGEIDSSPVMWKAVNLEGVSGVGSRAMFDRMNRAIEATEFEPVIDRTFAFDEVREAYCYLESGQHQGKVVITVD
jgi:NADPH:quinone reductase-like Zn-dependent oxidoreductase